MKKKIYFTLATLMTVFTLNAQEVTVFEGGKDGYASFRIPAIVKNTNGDLIAFSEGRVDNAGDYGNVDIVYKISQDQGKTWGKINVAADYDKLQAGNAAPVVDEFDPSYPEGRIFLFYNTGNNHEHEVRKGNGLREVWYITSTDGAKTWSTPINITTQAHKPNQPSTNSAYNSPENWRAYANTPGHGLQFITGKYKGRIFIPANHSQGDPKDGGRDYFAHGYYSDDHGQSFKLSESSPFAGSNESMAAQISDTDLYMSSRNQTDVRTRIISYSRDAGTTWDTTFYDKNLPDPGNQASTLSWKKGKKFILAVCNAADTLDRDNLTLRLSKDGGKSWYLNKTIAKAPEGYKGAYSAYSDIVLLDKNTIGVFYEKDRYKTIVFTPVNIK